MTQEDKGSLVPEQPTLSLRVTEAAARDVGRGVARLDPQHLAALGVGIGDVIEISGKRTTVARAMPAYSDQRGQGLIQMDGILRANAGRGVDERVSVHRADVHAARVVTLAPLEGARGSGGLSRTRYLSHLLEGIPVVEGDQVRIDLIGASAQTYKVTGTTPGGPVLIGPATEVRLASDERQAAGGASAASTAGAITYEDIGGLRREVRRIREMVELPLRYPEVFERLGIDPPKGVLLHGPPGCGKTLIARAVAHETSAHFFHVNGPEIIDKWYGASEAHLRDLFEEARKQAPAIIFIDEIDAIAPKREEMSGDRQVERRVVAQLLALMDGLKSRGQVTVIAATNIPNTLDPALRRPGRFDREIAISVPDKQGRNEILAIHTRGMPLAPDVDIDRLASVTHGFVGADLEALGREAAMSALRRLMPDIDFAQAHIPYDKLLALEVTMDDFRIALNEVEPSAIREVFTEVPDVGWGDVGGLEEVKRRLIEAVEWPLQHSDLLSKAGVRPAKGILLHGAPGTGKTLLAKALARESEANFISIKGPQLLSMWVGESERGVREVFRKGRLAAPCILFFDEIDALAPKRSASSSQVTERVVSQLLTEMDGIETLRGVVVLAATNRMDLLDAALLRPGRFDLAVELPVPDEPARAAILRIHTRKMPLGTAVDIGSLAAQTEGLTGADLESLCQHAALLAVRAYLDHAPADQGAGAPAEGSRPALEITPAHVALALAEARRR
jgi:transitional endoplasmic reticulum ATPase